MQKIQGFSEQGVTTVLIAGTGYTSSNKFQGSFPGCTVTVRPAGDATTLSTIYADSSGTSKANPFTSGTDGTWFFYAKDTLYDITFSGGGILIPFTLGSLGVDISGTIDLTTIPSFGSLWRISDATLISIVVAANVGTVTTSTPHGLTAGTGVVDIAGCYTDDELNNGAAIVQTTPTPTTFTVTTSGVANGTYTDSSLAVQDRSGGIFGSDLSNVFATKFTIEASVDRTELYDQYFDYPLYPRIVQYYVKSGYSGTTAIVNGAAGVSQVNKKLVPVNDTTGFSGGQVILLTNAAGLVETRKINTISAGVSITLTTDLDNDYVSGDTIGIASRTSSNAYFTDLQMFNGAGGDLYGHTIRIELANAPQWGQNHPYYNGTGGLMGGDVTASANQVYGQATEVSFIDAGFDVTMIGDVRSYFRTADTAANKQVWIGAFHQSVGSKNANACFVAAGSWLVPFDAVAAGDTANMIAFQMRYGQRFYLNSSKSVSATNPQPLYGDTVGNAYFTYNNATSEIEFYTGNTLRFRITATGIVAAGTITSGGNLISGGSITPATRTHQVQVSVTAANNLTLGAGNSNYVNGGTQINLIDSTGWQNGDEVTLIFSQAITIKNNQVASGAFLPMFLAGGVDLVAGNSDSLKLTLTNGTSWVRTGGSDN